MPDLLTLAEIQALPRWARIAFAARCARRVQPLFAALWLGATEEHIAAIDHAISRAEQSAMCAVSTADAYVAAAGDAAQAYAAAAVQTAVLVARAATRVAYATAAYTTAADAAYAAYADAAEAAEAFDAAAATAIRCDYDLLCALSQRDAWDDNFPVPPELFGPLWPDGPPADWPED